MGREANINTEEALASRKTQEWCDQRLTRMLKIQWTRSHPRSTPVVVKPNSQHTVQRVLNSIIIIYEYKKFHIDYRLKYCSLGEYSNWTLEDLSSHKNAVSSSFGKTKKEPDITMGVEVFFFHQSLKMGHRNVSF